MSDPRLQPPHPPSADTILRALATAHPPAGLEARLLQTLTAAPPVVTASRPPRRWFPALTLAAALAAIVLVLAHAPHDGPKVSHVPSQLPSPPGEATTSGAPSSPAASSLAKVESKPLSTATTSGAPSSPAASSLVKVGSSPPTLAALETAAPSHPAPPLPFTDGEREIRRFAQRHSAYEVAALDSRFEPLHERAERRDFNNFFAPPPEPSGNGPLVATALDRPNSFEPAPPPRPGPPLAQAHANPSEAKPTPGELLCCSAFVASATPQ